MKKSLSIIVASFFLLCGSLHAQDVPRIISYQGVLVDANGTPKTQKGVNFGFTFYAGMNSSTIVVPIQNKTLDVVGGLFNTMLEIPVSAELNQELWLEIEANGTRYPNRIRMATALYALNIADNVVTSRKIKDGEVDLQDLAPGNTPGEILKWDGTKWVRGQDEGLRAVTVEQPIEGDGTSTDPLRVTIPSGVPIGTIVAFYGLTSQIHPDWLLCDGRSITQQQYPLLFNHLNELYNSSILPDLRGMFLRGADLGTNQDPDNAITAGKRQYPTGIGSNLEKIGSVQGDEIKKHKHVWPYYWYGAGPKNGMVYPSMISHGQPDNAPKNPDATSAPEFGGSETRPKNVYVNYIIKAK